MSFWLEPISLMQNSLDVVLLHLLLCYFSRMDLPMMLGAEMAKTWDEAKFSRGKQGRRMRRRQMVGDEIRLKRRWGEEDSRSGVAKIFFLFIENKIFCPSELAKTASVSIAYTLSQSNLGY